MRLGTCLPRDESANVNGEFSIDKALELISKEGIKGCMFSDLVADESLLENFRFVFKIAKKCRYYASGVLYEFLFTAIGA